jgi:Ca2+/Na+ antiporter
MADNLTVPARDFHERSKLKFAVSILTAAFGLMFLGFCSTSAGIASSYQSLLSEYQSGSTDDHTTNSYQSLIGSYGKNFTLNTTE